MKTFENIQQERLERQSEANLTLRLKHPKIYFISYNAECSQNRWISI